MQQLIEFIGNHPLLIAAFFAVLGMLIYTEYARLSSGVPNLAPFAATQLLNDGEAVFVDVREEKEFKHEIDKFKDTDVVVYCDNGMRASRMIGKLKKQGFSKISTIAGGLANWEKANLPLASK